MILYRFQKGNIMDKKNRKIEELNELIGYCKNSEFKEQDRIVYAEKAMKIAIKNNNKKAEVEINKIIGTMYFNNGNLKKSRIYLNRVLDIAIASEDQIEIAKAKRNLGSLLMEQHHFDDSLQYYFSAKEIYKSVNLTEDIVDINRLIGMIYYWKSEYQKALKIYKDCLENLDKRNLLYANILVQMGSIFTKTGDFPKALKYMLESVALREKYHQGIGLENVFINIGETYKSMNKIADAHRFFLKALELYKKGENKTGISKSLNNLGTTSYRMNNKEQALKYYHSSLKLSEELKDNFTSAAILNNLAIVYSDANEHSKAISNYENALKIKRNYGHKSDVVTILMNIAQEYKILEDYEKSQALLTEALKLAEESQMKTKIFMIQKIISEIYEKQKKYKNALIKFKKYAEIKEETYNEENMRKIAEMQTKYETEQKEKEAEILRKKNKELETKNKLIEKQKEELQDALDKLHHSEIKYKFVSSELNKQIGSTLIGESEIIKKIINLISIVAKSDTTNVLISGESGTGKEIVAHNIHKFSKRSKKNFYSVNSAAIPDALFESQFFGYEKNSFTGAASTRIGWFEIADKSTLFLDEIGTMSIRQQAKLLRVLEEHKILRIGSLKEIPVDVRIICATNINLLQKVNEHSFRDDLYHRLSSFVIHIPPLRERKEDIPLLVRHFVKMFTKTLNKKISRIDDKVHLELMNYDFPGNVRELRNLVERAVLISDSSTLKPEHFVIPKANADCEKFDDIIPLEEMEKKLVLKALKASGFNQRKAAELLNVNRKVIERRIKKYGLKPNSNC